MEGKINVDMRDNNSTAAYNCWKAVNGGMVSKNMGREENEKKRQVAPIQNNSVVDSLVYNKIWAELGRIQGKRSREGTVNMN